MSERKFDPRHLQKLNDPQRLQTLKPDLLWELLEIKDPEVLVDVGAGTGFFALCFAGKMRKGKIYACDTAPEMVAYMQEHIGDSHNSRIVPVQSEETRIPLPSGLADLVYMINLHHELENPDLLLAESRRLLRAGGRLLIVDWKPEETPEGPPLAIRIPPAVVTEQLKSAGFFPLPAPDPLPFHFICLGRKV